MAKRCPFCQKEMPDEANFCLNCFSALGTEASPESCGAKNGNHDEKPTHKHTKKHISKPKAENALPLVNKKARRKIFAAAVLVCTFLLCGILAVLTRKQIRTAALGEPETMAVLVTDENGEAVTDENGDNVYEYVEVPQEEKGFSESFSAVLRITKTTPKAPTIHTPKTAAKAKRCRTKPRTPFIRPEIRVREPSAAIRGAAKPKRTLQIILRRHRRG